MTDKGILDAYLGKKINLILDQGDVLNISGGRKPIITEGNLCKPRNPPEDSHGNTYDLLVEDWYVRINFEVAKAVVKFDLAEDGTPEDITITVLPTEIF